MRNSSPVQLANAVSMGASANSTGIYLNQTIIVSLQAIWTGVTAAGTVKIQVSNDNVRPVQFSDNGSAGDVAANVVNWSDYSGTSQTVAGAGSFAWTFSDFGFAWIRLVFTRTSGTGSLTVNAWVKGN